MKPFFARVACGRSVRQTGMLVLLLAVSVAAHWLALSLVPIALDAPDAAAANAPFKEAQQNVVVWMVEEKPPLSALRPPPRNDVTTVFDPTLIASSGDRGFAHRVSRGMSPVTYRPQPQQQQPRLTQTTQFAQTRAAAMVAAPLPQQLAARWTKLEVAPTQIEELFLPPLSERPPLELRGALANRPVAVGFRLPELAQPPAKPTVLALAVDGDGRVRSVLIKSSSGSEQADGLAADAASRMIFVPSNAALRPVGVQPPAAPSHLEWGEAIIFWRAKSKPAEPPDTP